jgi:hypothetical protein
MQLLMPKSAISSPASAEMAGLYALTRKNARFYSTPAD